MKYVILLPVLSCMAVASVLAQGCSDAGFCSVGSFKENFSDSSNHANRIMFNVQTGVGDEGVFIITPALQFDYAFSERATIQTKVTANHASGNLGTATGAGDLYLSGIFTIRKNAHKNVGIAFTSGIKIPLNKSTLATDAMVLPMPYQSSLGTTDLLGALSFTGRSWQLSAGLQQPISGRNNNTFLPEDFDDPDASAYVPSNQLNRKGDLLLKSTYMWRLTERLNMHTGMLGIYHLGNDTYKSATGQSEMTLMGSKGLTLNVAGSIFYTLSPSCRIGLSGGVPLIVRDIRPDGLTRSFVLIPEVSFSW